MTIGSDEESLQGKLQAMAACFILGFGALISWNSMLTIGDYYYKLFPDCHPMRVLTLLYQSFALGTMAILLYYESRINTRKRNLFGYSLICMGTLLLIFLDLTTSGKGGAGTYVGICVIVGCFGLADAHIRGGMIGDLSLMCPEFIQSYLAGMAASGALTSSLRLIAKVAFDKSPQGLRKGAMLFLATSTFFEVSCIVLYAIVFPKLPIVKYYRSKAALEGSKTVLADLAAAGIQTRQEKMNSSQDGQDIAKNKDRLGNKELFVQNIDYAIDLMLIYVLTFSIFPGFLYENTGQHKLDTWYPLVLIASCNVSDLISRYIPLIQFLKLESRSCIMIASFARFLLVPAFYFTAKYGDQGWMILLTSFLGFSNGYLTICVFTSAPKGYKGPEKNALGNLLMMSLLCSIFAGVGLDWLWLIGAKSAF